MSSELIKSDIHIPTPPNGEEWVDKARDHDGFQKIVSLAAQLGGVSAGAGCLTPGAEQARQSAEQEYYRSQEMHPKQIIKLNKV